MASLATRLAALEKVVEGRWGEYDKPAGSTTADIETANTSPELLAAIVEVLKGIEDKMTTFKEAMDKLVAESTETGSAIDAFILQSNANIALLRQNAQDPEAILQIANTQEAYQQRLASALVANTPATKGDVTEPAVPVADPVAAPPTPAEAATNDATAVVVPPALTDDPGALIAGDGTPVA